MAKAILWNELNFEDIYLSAPTRNKRDKGRSTHATCSFIQFGEADAPTCIIQDILNTKGMFALKVSLTTEMCTWLKDFEAYLVEYTAKYSQEWFGVTLEIKDVKRMLCSIEQNQDIILKCGKRLKCYRSLDDQDTLERMSFKDVRPGDVIVPVVNFDGMYIASRHFTPSFTIDHLLVVGHQEGTEMDNNPFIDDRKVYDIVDPFSFYNSEGDQDSAGSFDTHVFTQ